MADKRKTLKWILACVLSIALTAVAMVYQNRTGPTNPERLELKLSDNQVYKLKLPRSHAGNTNCLVEISVPDVNVYADVFYRRYPTNEEWHKVNMVRVNDKLTTFLPVQPPAGKLEYYFEFASNGGITRLPSTEQVVIRFRGEVPAGIILPHVLFIFIAMLLSNLALFLALFGIKQYRVAGWITFITLFLGGLVFGPLVQKYAFGQYWTGFPLGMDLTDNKTLIAFIFWLAAIIGNLKKDRRYLTVLAAIVMFVIFSIPHSVRGSELNPETGKIETGK